MNIFVLDQDPIKSAQYQADKHVVKMILESAQLLCTTHHMCPSVTLPDRFYKLTHKNHPCNIWLRESLDNYKWLCRHALALCTEYTFRYCKLHASQDIIKWCDQNDPDIPNIGLTPFAQAMPDEYKNDDPVNAYRDYYWYDKRHKFKCVWTKREKPYWWVQQEAFEEMVSTNQELGFYS